MSEEPEADRATAGERECPTFLYHWSPLRNRSSIDRHGLRPGGASNLVPEWKPPHVCYGETPSAALALTLLGDVLDLWMVRTDGHCFALSNDGSEWRTAEAVPAWYVASRAPRDSVTYMNANEQAEADEVVAYLHEESIANGEDDD